MAAKKYISEGLGAFILATVAIMLLDHAELQAPLAIGAALLAITYAFSEISGGHFNPSVSFAAYLHGDLRAVDFPYYLASQIAGSTLGGFLAVFLLGCQGGEPVLMRRYSPFCTLIAEFAGTLMFSLLVLLVIRKHKRDGNSRSGLAAGFAYTGLSFALLPVCGALLNPVLSLAACMAGYFPWENAWAFLFGSPLGAAAAFSIFRGFFESDNTNSL